MSVILGAVTECVQLIVTLHDARVSDDTLRSSARIRSIVPVTEETARRLFRTFYRPFLRSRNDAAPHEPWEEHIVPSASFAKDPLSGLNVAHQWTLHLRSVPDDG